MKVFKTFLPVTYLRGLYGNQINDEILVSVGNNVKCVRVPQNPQPP